MTHKLGFIQRPDGTYCPQPIPVRGNQIYFGSTLCVPDNTTKVVLEGLIGPDCPCTQYLRGHLLLSNIPMDKLDPWFALRGFGSC